MKITSSIFSKEPFLQNSSCFAGPSCFFLLQTEEGKGVDEGGGTGGQTPTMRESVWCTTLVVAKDLLRYISYRDKVLPSGVTDGSPSLIRSGGSELLVPFQAVQSCLAGISMLRCRCLGIPSVQRAIGRDDGVFLLGLHR